MPKRFCFPALIAHTKANTANVNICFFVRINGKAHFQEGVAQL